MNQSELIQINKERFEDDYEERMQSPVQDASILNDPNGAQIIPGGQKERPQKKNAKFVPGEVQLSSILDIQAQKDAIINKDVIGQNLVF